MKFKISYLKQIIKEELQICISYKKYEKLKHIFEVTKKNKILFLENTEQIDQEKLKQLQDYIRQDIPYALADVLPEYFELAKQAGLRDQSIVYVTIMDTVSEEFDKVINNASPEQIQLTRQYNELFRDVENTLAKYHEKAQANAQMGGKIPSHLWKGSEHDPSKPSYDWKKKPKVEEPPEEPKGEKTASGRGAKQQPVLTSPPKKKGGTEVIRGPKKPEDEEN
jgi:hypothetical protein